MQYQIDCANVQLDTVVISWQSRLEKAVELSPNDIGLLHQLAQSELELGNFGAAVDAYRKALISEPEHLGVGNLGSVEAGQTVARLDGCLA